MGKAVVEVDSLVKQYAKLKAVDGISFEVDEGEIFDFLGPNGTGKTTCAEKMERKVIRQGAHRKSSLYIGTLHIPSRLS
jgi:ABC-2 type transport system ATP-binding protein